MIEPSRRRELTPALALDDSELRGLTMQAIVDGANQLAHVVQVNFSSEQGGDVLLAELNAFVERARMFLSSEVTV